jgi:hypothetical protein
MAPNEIRKIHLPEERVIGKRLGRHVEHDPRSRDFPAHLATQIVSVNHQATGLPLDQGQIGSCFPPGTRVRMADGSERSIEDVRLGERVVTAEGRTGRVIRTMLRDEDSGMVRLILWGHSHLRMTREHPVLTARGYIPAAELRIGDEVALPRYRSDQPLMAISPGELVRRHKVGSTVLPEKIGLNEKFGRLFGLWLAEGSADGTKVRWNYGGHEGATLVPETVRLVREVFGAEAHAVRRPNGTWWVTLYGIPWNTLFKILGGARVESKRPHPLLCAGSADFLAAMLDGWLDGDGYVRPDGYKIEGVTVSSDLALAMYDIAQALGRHPVLVFAQSPQNRHAARRLPRWTLSLASGLGRCRQDETHVWRKVRELRVEDYVGPVYNLSVEGDESYVAEGVGVHNCTANALCGALNSDPDYTGGPALTEKDAISLYELETKLEGEPYPPNDPGGTGLMVCKAAKQLGMITSYRHTFSLNSALRALVLRPVITGVKWYSSFDTPDESGLVEIAPGARVRGGHEIVADQIDAENNLVWFWNSWGPNYGVGGKFCMSFDTWGQLLQEQGDVTVPIK